jgi:hypothetical protein
MRYVLLVLSFLFLLASYNWLTDQLAWRVW